MGGFFFSGQVYVLVNEIHAFDLSERGRGLCFFFFLPGGGGRFNQVSGLLFFSLLFNYANPHRPTK